MPTSELLPSRDVADRLGVHIRTVHRLVKSGQLEAALVAPGYRGDFLFDPAEVERVRLERELDRFAVR